MKKTNKKGLIFILLLFVFVDLNAQRKERESILTVGFGLGMWNFIASAINLVDSADASSIPTINATYDYGITHNFSLGAAVSYNSISISNPNYSYINSAGVIIYERISVDYSRVNVALRPLYHWGKRENFEWHTGLRLGYSFWNAQLNTTDPYYSDQVYQENSYSFQVLFGSRAYVSEFISITFDVGLIEPYIASLGLSLKL